MYTNNLTARTHMLSRSLYSGSFKGKKKVPFSSRWRVPAGAMYLLAALEELRLVITFTEHTTHNE